jgi:zinc protease
MKKLQILLSVGLLAANFGVAQTQKKTNPPKNPVVAAKAVLAPLQEISNVEGIKEYQLPNGLKVLLIPDESQSNLVVNIVYHVGSRHEGYGESGMAHLLEHMLFKSTKKLGDIKKMLSEKGGNANGTTWLDRTNYYEVFPTSDENLKWSLEMEADRMINATLLQSDLDKEFSVVRNEFEIGENNPEGVLTERVLSSAYSWHNYGKSTIGSKEDIERVKVDRLRPFYEKYYQPDNATLVIAGKFDTKNALKYIQETFGAIPKPTRKLEPTYTLEPAQDGERYVEVRRNGDSKTMGTAYHTVPYSHEDFPLIDLLLSIHFNNPSGFLYKNLIETKKVASQYQWTPTVRDAAFAYMSFQMDMEKDQIASSKEILKELDAIQTTQITDADLQRGKSDILKYWENNKNKTVNFAIDLTEAIGAGDFRLSMLYRDRIEKAKTADLERVAKTYFKSNNRTYGLFIPSNNEERVKPVEVSSEQISSLTKDYKGKAQVEENLAFETTIPNVIKSTKDFALPNGFKYSILKKPVKGGKVNIRISIPMGSEVTLKGKKYIAEMMGNLMLAGTSDMTKAEINDKIDALKANVNFSISEQNLSIRIESYKDKLPELLPIVQSVLNRATFPQKEVETSYLESKVFLENDKKEPQSIVFTGINRFSNNYEADHILYTPTPQEKIEGLSKVTQAQIVDFYKNFLNLGNGYGTVLGEIDETIVQNWLSQAFNQKTGTEPYLAIQKSNAKTTGETKEELTPDKENAAVAGIITFNFSEKHPDYPAMVMLSEMLGSGGFMTARIPTRLREKEGISYGAGSWLEANPIMDVSQIGIYAFFNPKAKDKVQTALAEELQKVVKEGFTEDELKKALLNHANSEKTNLGFDNYLSYLNNKKFAYQVPVQATEDLENKIQKITVEQVNQVAKKYLDPQKISWIYAGDFNKK